MKIIARIQNDFPEKFGIPRQSGLVPALQAQIVFEPAYRNPAAVKGLEAYSHIWLLWQFFRGTAGYLVAYGAPAAVRRQQTCRCVCHPFPPFGPIPLGCRR